MAGLEEIMQDNAAVLFMGTLNSRKSDENDCDGHGKDIAQF